VPKFWFILCCAVLVSGCASKKPIDESAIKISHFSSSSDSEKLNLSAKPDAFEFDVNSNIPEGVQRIKATSFVPSSLPFIKSALCFIDCTRLVGKFAIVERFEATLTTTTVERQPFNTAGAVRSLQAGDAVANAILKLVPDRRLYLANVKLTLSSAGKFYTGVAEATADDPSRAVVLAANSAAFNVAKALE
jgi:hypothetical protein